MTHLRLVPPAKPPFEFEAEIFAFAKVGDAIFICHKGVWTLARDAVEASDALARWVALAGDFVEPPLPWPLPKVSA